MIGWAQITYKKLSKETQDNYEAYMWERFEPESKRLYLTKCQTRSKQITESCAAFAKGLKIPVSKAFSKLQADTKEQLALMGLMMQMLSKMMQCLDKLHEPLPHKDDSTLSVTNIFERGMM